MSTLKATNLSHASAASPNIVLDSAGKTTFGGAVAGAGMDLITPTSVAGSGVTVSGGAVSFSGSTTVSVNGCFTSTYENYLLLMQNVASASSVLRVRLRDAGGDLTGGNYSYGSGGFDSGGGTQNFGAGSQTSFVLGYSSTLRTSCALTIIGPNLSQNTQITGTAEVINSLDTVYVGGVFGAVHFAGTVCTGISIYPTSGTFTGSLRVYGYRNS